MKKDGIQTRNRKVSNRNKKGKKSAASEVYPDMSHLAPPDEHVGPYSLNPGSLLSYSHTPHLLPPSTLHSSPTMPYSHHPNSGMVPTLVWRKCLLDREAWTHHITFLNNKKMCKSNSITVAVMSVILNQLCSLNIGTVKLGSWNCHLYHDKCK